MSQSEITQELNELIEICQDGKDFYKYAAHEVQDPALKDLFTSMVRIREAVIAELSVEVIRRGDTPEGEGSLLGTVRRIYAALKKEVTADSDETLVAQLEEAEDRTLEAFREALKEPPTPALSQILNNHLTVFTQTHEKMRTLKKAA